MAIIIFATIMFYCEKVTIITMTITSITTIGNRHNSINSHAVTRVHVILRSIFTCPALPRSAHAAPAAARPSG